jgi:hypothetical protein
LGYAGTRLSNRRLVTRAEAEEQAHYYNVRLLKRRIVDLLLFQGLETGLGNRRE